MDWISNYQLFLFDLDGLLVDTEQLHWRAYAKMCSDRGYKLDWDFITYFKIAQQDAQSLQQAIYKKLPALQKEEPNWHLLYTEKKAALRKLMQSEEIPLMPGVAKLLEALEKRHIKRCVVTHSSQDLVAQIQEKNPVLRSIPHWITKEQYAHPKPAPDGYLQAISRFATEKDAIIGFEDSTRGMESLLQTRATPIYINALDADTRAYFAGKGVAVFSSFELFSHTSLP